MLVRSVRPSWSLVPVCRPALGDAKVGPRSPSAPADGARCRKSRCSAGCLREPLVLVLRSTFSLWKTFVSQNPNVLFVSFVLENLVFIVLLVCVCCVLLGRPPGKRRPLKLRSSFTGWWLPRFCGAGNGKKKVSGILFSGKKGQKRGPAPRALCDAPS